MTPDIGKLIHYLKGLRAFLGKRLTYEEGRDIIIKRLAMREQLFLDFLKLGVYGNEEGPYAKMLSASGIGYRDVESLVREAGIEGALKSLAEKGIYLTVDEFKGRADYKRNGLTVRFNESDFDNVSGPGFLSRSGGTRSRGTHVFFNFEHIEETAPYTLIIYEVFSLQDAPCVVWFPAGLGLYIVLSEIKLGKAPLRWFSQVDWTFQLSNKPMGRLRDQLMEAATRIICLTRGVRFPRPEYVPLDETEKVVDFLAELSKKHRKFCVKTYPSSALRAAKIAREKGKSIRGAYFLIGGEPVTEAKKIEIERSGAKVVPNYSSMEAGYMSIGCGSPKVPDDTHILADGTALIQHRRKVASIGCEVDSNLVTTFLPKASKVLLNVEMGDTGVLEGRGCGCGWERLGFLGHIHTIRSFEKMTGEGMTMLNSDILRIVEEVLPARFGGSMTDYQILEEEDEGGVTSVKLLVSPELGGLDEKKILSVLVQELRAAGKGGGSSNLSLDVWVQNNTLKIVREYPKTTAVGKIFTFQIGRKEEIRH